MNKHPNEPGQIDLSILEQATSSSKRISGGQGFKFVNYSQQELEHRRRSAVGNSTKGLLFLNMHVASQPQPLPESRVATMKPSTQGFTFVNTSTSSEKEKGRNRTVIRSEVMKRFWRKTRTEWTVIDHASRVKPEAEEVPNETAPPNELIETMTDALVASYLQPYYQLAPHELVRFYDLSGAIVQSPYTLLGAGNVDPFRTHPYRRENSFVSELISHRLTLDLTLERNTLFPVLAPSGVPGKQSPFTVSWLRYAMHNPLAFYAIMWGTSLHLDIVSEMPRLNEVERILFKTETIRLLHEDLRDPLVQIGDPQLLAIFILATHDSFDLQDAVPEIFPVALSKIGWLNIYWRMAVSDLHMKALFTAVELREGLETIQLVGLAEICSYADIMYATRNLTHPQFPLILRVEHQRKLMKNARNLAVDPHWDVVGAGFAKIESCPFFTRIKGVVSEMCIYTTQVDNYVRGTLYEVNQKQFAEDRNAIHHSVLSLPTAEQMLQENQHFSILYEPCRLALLIYSAAVIFPTPTYTGIYKKLAKCLHDVLSETDLNFFSHDQPELLLWIWVLGGMSAFSCVERNFFVTNLANVKSLLAITSWEVLRGKLKTFLWLDTACDPPGRALWTEVEMCLVL